MPDAIEASIASEHLSNAEQRETGVDDLVWALNQIGIAPETKLTTRTGRPMSLFANARVLHELIL